MIEERKQPVRRSNVWREQVLTRVAYLEALAEWIKHQQQIGPSLPAALLAQEALENGIRLHLSTAKRAAEGNSVRSPFGSSSSEMESALGSVHAAEELMLLRAPGSYVQGRLPEIHAEVRQFLDGNDPRRIHLEKLVQRNPGPSVDDEAQESIVTAVTAAHNRSREDYMQVRSFRNALVITAVVLTSLAVILAVFGFLNHKNLALCFYPEELKKVVCPINESPFDPANGIPPAADIDVVVEQTAGPGDILLVEFVGLVAAALSGSASLRKVKGTTTPFSLPIALTLVKLPAGALTAVLGLVLMRGGFVPGLSALDSSPQIIAWAVIFGASQQLVTGLVDRQGQAVLENVGGKPHSVAERPATE